MCIPEILCTFALEIDHMKKFAQILTKIIDFFHRPFDKWISEQLFRYAACGGGNLVLDWLLYFLIYNSAQEGGFNP